MLLFLLRKEPKEAHCMHHYMSWEQKNALKHFQGHFIVKHTLKVFLHIDYNCNYKKFSGNVILKQVLIRLHVNNYKITSRTIKTQI